MHIDNEGRTMCSAPALLSGVNAQQEAQHSFSECRTSGAGLARSALPLLAAAGSTTSCRLPGVERAATVSASLPGNDSKHVA